MAQNYERRLLLLVHATGAGDGGGDSAGTASPLYFASFRTVSDTDSDDNDAVLMHEETLKRCRDKHKSKNPGVGGKLCMCNVFRPFKRPLRLRSLCRVLPCMLLAPMLFLMLYMPLYPNMQTRQVALDDWGYNTSRNLADYVLPENETTLLEPRNVCRDKLFLLVIVCSSMQNFAIRQIIRETWANTTQFNYGMFAQLHGHLRDQYLDPPLERLQYYSEYLNLPPNQATTTAPSMVPVRVLFLVGRSQHESLSANDTLARIRSEAAFCDDIIQENFVDTYNNLTLKSVMALKWLSRRCQQRVAFFMKCDDDTFLNMPNLLHYLLGGTIPLYKDTIKMYDLYRYRKLAERNRLESTADYLAGHLYHAVIPVATPKCKWYMPKYMYPGGTYPVFLSGAAYVMSGDVVQRLYETALNTTFIYAEDIFLTGICAERMHLRRHHQPLFGYARPKKWCTFRGSITQHKLDDKSLLKAYDFVTNTSIRCPPPTRYTRKRLRRRRNRV